MQRSSSQGEMGQIESQSQRLGFFGSSGSGKTTKARELISNLKNVIVFDPVEEWARCARSWFKSNYRVINGDLAKFERYLRTNYNKEFVIIFVPSFGEEVSQLSKLSKILAQAQNGYKMGQHSRKLTLVVDELDMGFKSGITQIEPQNGFAYLCKRGRHYGINLVGISQRINQVDICFRGNLSAMYLFRQAEPRDVQTAIAYFGREHAGTVKALNNFQYVYKAGAIISTNF